MSMCVCVCLLSDGQIFPRKTWIAPIDLRGDVRWIVTSCHGNVKTVGCECFVFRSALVVIQLHTSLDIFGTRQDKTRATRCKCTWIFPLRPQLGNERHTLDKIF